jgi:LAO/AO transport system kinase
MKLVEQILCGDRLALAKVITQVENDTAEGHQSLDQLFNHSGKGHIIGITGPSGAGKSTLVNALVKAFLASTPKAKLGVIAVDPTSPFTGGALLGDRVRMRDIATDERVFVRSMATRGALGGLSRTVPAVIQLMDAAGYDPILVETVGAGQAEVEIARVAHTTIVVEAPGLGDDVQAIKAGILEIADILVINKADRPGVDGVIQSLQSMLNLGYPHRLNGSDSGQTSCWIPPILPTVATEEKGIQELLAQILNHKKIICQNGEWQEKDKHRLEAWLESLYAEKISLQLRKVSQSKTYAKLVASLLSRQISPFQAVEKLFKMDLKISS